jgi:hypothetical protein
MTIEKMRFYLGVTLALRAECDRLRTHPIREFHAAFGKMIEEARVVFAEDLSLGFLFRAKYDPCFGTWQEASEMWLEGQGNLLLRRCDNQVIFNVSKPEAAYELEKLADAYSFRKIAKVFVEALRAANLVVK